MDVIAKLIGEIEKADEPNRTLDARIELEVRRWEAYAIGLNDEQRAQWKPVGTKGEVEEGGTRYHSPTYAFHVDEALKLIPKGSGMNLQGNGNCWYAVVHGQYSAACRTPALAICAAAL